MAITPGLCVEAKLALLRGAMQPSDVYKVALYTEAASLNSLTDTYTSTNEVRGQGYTAGGQVLEGIEFGVDGVTAMMGFSKNPVWRNATINARGALIYNATRKNMAVVVLDFRQNVISTNGNWTLPLPPMTAATALVRLS